MDRRRGPAYDSSSIAYLNGGELRVERLAPRHASIYPKLREADMTEIEMSSPINPMLQVGYCIAESRPGYAVTRRGEPIVIFGVTGTASGAGSPWLLATDAIKEYPIVFYRKSKDFIREMREMYDELENYVYCGNDLSIRWLGWAGFEFDEPQGDFMRFWWKRGDARCAQ